MISRVWWPGTAAAALLAVVIVVGGYAGQQWAFGGSDDAARTESRAANATSTTATSAPTKTIVPSVNPTPRIPSTPYTFINPRTYLDGQLTLEAVDGLQTRKQGPKSIVPGIDNGETVDAIASSGFEINPTMAGSAQDVVDLINVGLLVAWSSQNDIPDHQRDLITSADEDKSQQLTKWSELKRRSGRGESFKLTLKAYKDDGFSDQDITLDIGESYRYFIDELVKPPVQIKWQSNSGSGIRVSTANRTFRIEFYDQYARALGYFSEKTFISSLIVDTVVYLPELVATGGQTRNSRYSLPDFDYQVNVQRPKFLAAATKFAIIPDALPGTYAKDWHDSAIHPLP